jgi:hypothetical protein
MKITRFLPRFLAKAYQTYHLERLEGFYGYHSGMARVCEQMIQEGRQELERLERKN